MVITSMLSRLWVIFRGILVGLSALYPKLLKLLREVADTQPMPFLKDFSLPADMTQFLGPSVASLLTKKSAHVPHAKEHKEKRRKKSSAEVKNQAQTRKVKEDLGVAIERGTVLDTDLKPFLMAFKNFTKDKSVPRWKKKSGKMQKFKKQMREATSFTDMDTRLEEMIVWCKSKKMKKEKRLLTFLRLKCQRMKCLEGEGYNVQRKLQTFRQEARWASSPRGSAPRSCRSSAATRRNAHLRTRFHSLRSRFRSAAARAGVKKKRRKRQREKTEPSASGLSADDQRNRTTNKPTSRTADCDDIDDIFASVGL